MRADNDEALLAGALALAYKYADVPALRAAYARAEAKGGDLDVVAALQEVGGGGGGGAGLSPARAERLRAAARLARRLRTEAVYGMVAIRNRLVGPQMLNACMEEARRTGFTKGLIAVLLERGVLTPALDRTISARRDEVLPELLAKERALASTIDLARDPPETADLKLGVLLGEVASKVSFLTRQDLDFALKAADRVARGLAPEEAGAPSASAPADGGSRNDVSLPAAEANVPLPMPGAGASSPESDPIKGYELLVKLGQGAMGSVLKARKRDTGEVVALKILKPDLANDREYVERFLREAKAVARLGHPNIIRAIQVGKAGDYYFFAMEFVEGQTCSDLLKQKGRLPERFAIMVTRCIASALAHAWQHQIIHRDIKPDNIMVTHDGLVKLTDLGLARTAKRESTLTMTGVVMGSPAYISPEQATGEKNLDNRSDIYSLGAALYHMLTGKVPYEGDSPLQVMLKHMNDPLPDARKVVPQVSDATRLLIFRMMAKRPEQRFQSAQEVEAAARAIEDALARGETPPLPPGVKVVTKAAGPPAARASGEAAPRASAEGDGAGAAKKPAPAAKKPAAAGRKSTAGVSQEKSLEKSKEKEVGERLRRMAAKKKKRF